MYPRNAASPEPIAIGAVVQISDGAVQTSGVTVRIKPIGVAEGDGGGTTAYSTDGIVEYTPTQAETNYTSFILIAKKTGCIPVAVTVITSASATAGYAGLDWGAVTNKTTTNALTGTTIATTQKVDVDTIKTGAVAHGGGTVTFPGSSTLASTTNITAGTITTTTNLTNLPAITSNWLTAAGIAAGALNGKGDWNVGKTGYSLTATTGLGNQTADITGSLSGSVGSVTGNVGGNVTGSVGSVLGGIDTTSGTVKTLDAAIAALATAHGSGSWATATGFSTHSAADVWAVATRVLTAGTNIVLAKGVGVTGFNDLSAAQVNAEVDTALTDYDGPTNAEMVARTPSATAIGNIELVFNTDFATNYTTVNKGWATYPAGYYDQSAGSNQQFPDNFASLGINGSGHISRVTLVDTTTTNTDMRGTNNAALAATALSTAVWTSTRAGYLDNLSAGAVALEATAQAILDDTGTTGVVVASGSKTGYVLTSAYDPAKTAAQAGDAMTLTSGERTSIADAVLGRSVSTIESTAAEHSLATIILAGLESSVSGTTWTIKRTDGTTTHYTKTVTTNGSADPITGVA